MNKQEVKGFLQAKGIDFKWFEHKAVYTVKQSLEIDLPHPEARAKNLFLRDEKKRMYCLVTLPDEKSIDLKQFADDNGLKRLSFASEEDLERILGLEKGSVTPLGLLNDEKRIVRFFLDEDFRGMNVYVHPNENTASVLIDAEDLLDIIREHGEEAGFVQIKGKESFLIEQNHAIVAK